jgi:hypothetical protein
MFPDVVELDDGGGHSGIGDCRKRVANHLVGKISNLSERR